MREVDSVRRVVDAMCAGIGRTVALVANYDGVRIDEALNDAYFAMVEGCTQGTTARRHAMRPVRSSGRSWAARC